MINLDEIEKLAEGYSYRVSDWHEMMKIIREWKADLYFIAYDSNSSEMGTPEEKLKKIQLVAQKSLSMIERISSDED